MRRQTSKGVGCGHGSVKEGTEKHLGAVWIHMGNRLCDNNQLS